MIEEKYNKLCATPSDIWEHLPTIKRYASECESIVELGVRGIVSTWAFLAGKPKVMLSVDIAHPSEFGANIWEVVEATEDAGISWSFRQASSLEIDLPEHDLLFIDTLHTYDQLSMELELHAPKAKKYIILHDMAIPELPEMVEAGNNFLKNSPEWRVKEHFKNNNGLTVLERV